MNKTDIIKEVSSKTSLSQKDCKDCLNAFLDLINLSLRSGDSVSLNGFGKFDVVTRKSRIGINPKTLSKIVIPNKNVVKFKPFKATAM